MTTTDSKDLEPGDMFAQSPFGETDERLSARSRFAAFAAALVLLLPIVVASRLHPDPTGKGTHRQLGLPPCTSVYLFGIRCPACGMTTSWSAVLHGRPTTAVRANATGAASCLIVLVTIPWLAVSGLRGRWVLVKLTEGKFSLLLFLLLASSFIEWGVRFWAGKT